MSVFLEKKALTNIDKSFSYPKDNYLRYEVEYQSFLNWWEDNWRQFDTLPFKINHQIDLFLNQWKEGGISSALDQLRMDLYGYYLEYIRQEGIIPFSLRVNSLGKVVGEFYGDKSITEIIDSREREGVVKEAMIDLERKLKDLKEEEIIFRISPSGWTGLDYDYSETQAQVFWRDKDRFRGLTIRTQIGLKEILSLVSSLGVDISTELNEKALIKYITSLNVTLPYSSWEFVQFLIDKFNNRDHQGRNLQAQIINWWERDHDFAHFDEIASLVNYLEKKVGELVNRGYSDGKIEEELPKLVGFVLMGMVGNVNDNAWEYSYRNIFYSESRFLASNVYDKTINYLQSLAGCAGGGKSIGESILTPFGTVGVIEADKYGSREFECPHCHKSIRRPKDQLLEKCPHCGGDVSC